MPMRMKQGAAVSIMVLALVFVGSSANAFWPFDGLFSRSKNKTPNVGAQEGQTMPPAGGTLPPPSGVQPMPQPTQPMMPQPIQPMPQPIQPIQPEQPMIQPSQPKTTTGDQFFCNSLGHMASRSECDAADRAKQGEQGTMTTGKQCEPNQVFCFQINRCTSPQECADATPVCAPGQKPSAEKPCKMDMINQKDFNKPPFPESDRNSADDERMQKEKDERFRMESEQSRKEIEGKMRMEQEERMKKEGMMQDEKKKPMPFPGQGATEGKFPGQGMTEGQFPGQGQMHEGEEQERPQFFFDPQFIKQMKRQVSDLKRELKRLLSQAKRLKDKAEAERSMNEVTTLTGKVEEFAQKLGSLKGEELQEAVEEFNELRLWDEVNKIRTNIELPKQLTEIERELKRTEKLFKQKAFKRLAEYGLGLEKMQQDLANIRATVAQVRELRNSGAEPEDIQDAMQEIWEGGHPGEISGVLHQMRSMTEGLRRIKKKEIREQILEIFQPIIDAVNDGDYREANQLLQELWPSMNRILPQLYKLRGGLNEKLQTKLQEFEQRIQSKFLKEQPTEPTEESLEAFPFGQ